MFPSHRYCISGREHQPSISAVPTRHRYIISPSDTLEIILFKHSLANVYYKAWLLPFFKVVTRIGVKRKYREKRIWSLTNNKQNHLFVSPIQSPTR